MRDVFALKERGVFSRKTVFVLHKKVMSSNLCDICVRFLLWRPSWSVNPLSRVGKTRLPCSRGKSAFLNHSPPNVEGKAPEARGQHCSEARAAPPEWCNE